MRTEEKYPKNELLVRLLQKYIDEEVNNKNGVENARDDLKAFKFQTPLQNLTSPDTIKLLQAFYRETGMFGNENNINPFRKKP